MPLKAVAFDVDGTLYPNGPMYLRSLGLILPRLRLFKALEKARIGLREQPDVSGDFSRVQASKVGALLGISTDEAEARIEAIVYKRWFRIFQHLKPYRGLAACLAAFRALGLKLGVLSDFPIRGRLEQLGLGPWDCAFSTEDSGRLKPHPHSFLLLAERLGLPPGDVLYVGNSYRYDVLGAHAAGMPVAHLTGRHVHGTVAALEFKRYAELETFVVRSLPDSGYNTSGRVPV